MSTQNRAHKQAHPSTLKTYIVQARFSEPDGKPLHAGRLMPIGEFLAQTHTGSIIQASQMVARCGGAAICEIVATLKG